MQVKLIREELTFRHGKTRNIKALLPYMSAISYFKLFEPKQMTYICEHIELINLPAQTFIFKQGDQEVYEYVILKGKVAKEILVPELQNIPMVLSTYTDGEQFGKCLKKPRETTCFTTEESDIFVISPALSY